MSTHQASEFCFAYRCFHLKKIQIITNQCRDRFYYPPLGGVTYGTKSETFLHSLCGIG